MQVEVKGRVNLDKLTAFLEQLRVSRSRTVSLGTLMCARDASAADSTHVAEVRCCYHSRQHTPSMLCGAYPLASLHVLVFAGNEWFRSVAHGAPLHVSAALCTALQCIIAHDLHCKLFMPFCALKMRCSCFAAHACCCAFAGQCHAVPACSVCIWCIHSQ